MADTQPDHPAENSLGLDLAALKIKDSLESAPSVDTKDTAPAHGTATSPDAAAEVVNDETEHAPSDAGDSKKDPKKKPYVNPDRVKTGGAQRVRPSVPPAI